MEEKKRNIDQILLNKAYDKLSAEEFLVVKNEFSSEKEYTELRAILLAATHEITSSEEIEPKAETKDLLMKEFMRVHPAMGSRAGGLGFLFPKGRSFYQQPGYQLIAVAAIIILIFTIYPKLSGNITSNNNMAQHEVSEPKSGEITKHEDVKTQIHNEDTAGITNYQLDIAEEDQNASEQPFSGTTQEIKSEGTGEYLSYKSIPEGDSKNKDIISNGTIANISTLDQTKESSVNAPVMEDTPSESYNWYSNGDTGNAMVMESTITTGADDDFNGLSNNSLNNSEGRNLDAFDSNTGGVVNMQDNELAVVEKEEALDEISSVTTAGNSSQKTRADKKTDAADLPIKKVKSLSENAELIDLFYTAM